MSTGQTPDPVTQAVNSWVELMSGPYRADCLKVCGNTVRSAVGIPAHVLAEVLRAGLASRVNAFIRDILLVPRPESPVADAVEISRIEFNVQGEFTTIPVKEAVGQLFQHIDHLERLIAFLLNTPEGQCYAEGYDAGKKAGVRGAAT